MLENIIFILDCRQLKNFGKIWKLIKTRIARTVPELKERLTQIWNFFTAADGKMLVDTIPKAN